MIFIGFGFLMTFLKTHSWTSVGLNYFVASWAVQLGILFYGFWTEVFNGFNKNNSLDLAFIIFGDLGAAAVLISFRDVIGKFNKEQMIL
jgi:ammonium transporter Rh